MNVSIEQKLSKFELILNDLHGKKGYNGIIWPVIVRREYYYENPVYEYQYSYPYFRDLKFEKEINLPYRKKSERISVIKFLIDKLISEDIDIYLYHFGLFCIYGDQYSRMREEDFSDSAIGKKRSNFAEKLPKSRFLSLDDYISAIWSYHIERRDTQIGDYQRNPSMSKVRILFDPDQFSHWTGRLYYDADWVEPLSGKMDLECKVWAGEHDPMAPLKIPEGWIEGPIVLGHEGYSNGLRHFVNGEPLHAGSSIQVKFGGGWVSGRYEWRFDKESPIQIHSGSDVFFINEGHLVRIRG